MLSFNGIEKEGLWLMAENRFHDSKAFYEENKGRIKVLILEPMSALIKDLTPMMQKLDAQIYLNPTRIISRVRRDTRFTKDKSLYRENVWFLLRRMTKDLPTPCFWLEVNPAGYNYGCSILDCNPQFMQLWRNKIDRSKRSIQTAIRPALKYGYTLGGEEYKKPKKLGLSSQLSKLYNRKEFYLAVDREDITVLSKPEALFQELTEGYTALMPIYRYTLKLCEEYIALQGSDMQTNAPERLLPTTSS